MRLDSCTIPYLMQILQILASAILDSLFEFYGTHKGDSVLFNLWSHYENHFWLHIKEGYECVIISIPNKRYFFAVIEAARIVMVTSKMVVLAVAQHFVE